MATTHTYNIIWKSLYCEKPGEWDGDEFYCLVFPKDRLHFEVFPKEKPGYYKTKKGTQLTPDLLLTQITLEPANQVMFEWVDDDVDEFRNLPLIGDMLSRIKSSIEENSFGTLFLEVTADNRLEWRAGENCEILPQSTDSEIVIALTGAGGNYQLTLTTTPAVQPD
jgi:hypothetical protein